ncbi:MULTISPECIES: glutaredoxin family protein [unclassified Neptuniibacter]|uniref:glutaredoxin family protein n=1 Tax=unclassified Neptuniibacter TaxID=2630693 RepID=UPI0025FA71A6|nr:MULTISPECIES: glutaredoxin family protein [unclassified Neptuniibacter]|tara:strand:- start:9916 stop:10170 length:255 start_codon:yes stop_codon:yes gene_type:complete
MRELELMGTVGCHLCEVAEAVISTHTDMTKYAVYQVDIAGDDELMEQYALTIPVLVDVLSGNSLPWPFDESSLNVFLAGLAKPD